MAATEVRMSPEIEAHIIKQTDNEQADLAATRATERDRNCEQAQYFAKENARREKEAAHKENYDAYLAESVKAQTRSADALERIAAALEKK